MRNFKLFFATVALISVSLSMSSCKDKTTEAKIETAVQEDEYTSAYVCPMHCEGSGSETEGTCPNCGMTYVENEAHKANGHSHE